MMNMTKNAKMRNTHKETMNDCHSSGAPFPASNLHSSQSQHSDMILKNNNLTSCK